MLTGDNFLVLLTHTITFQIWRPDPGNRTYTLVGSNKLTFSGKTLRDGVTAIPGRTDIAHFSFSLSVPESEWIHFAPGDVVGWFIPTSFGTIMPPLSVLYSNATALDDAEVIVDMYTLFRGREPCMVCDIHEISGAGVKVTSVVPLMSAVFGESVDKLPMVFFHYACMGMW